jgi:DNA repair exonuclease SbcCD ATPase subunit
VSEEGQDPGLRERLSRQGEEALGKIAEELAGNPMVTGALSRAFEAREKALQAQEAAMGALGIPSSADIERLTRRLRSVSQRLEGIEDSVDRLEGIKESVDRLDERLESIERGVSSLDGQLDKLSGKLDKLAKAKPAGGAAGGKAAAPAKQSRAAAKAEAERAEALEGRLEEIGRDLEALRRAVAPGEEPPPRAQERLTVSES